MNNQLARLERTWVQGALRALHDEAEQTEPSPLVALPIPGEGIELFLKDEAKLPTGSLRHRHAGALFVHALCNGDIRQGTRLVAASTGAMAIASAFFAHLVGVPFTAVMPAGTGGYVTEQVEAFGGVVERVREGARPWARAVQLGAQDGWHHLDQFGAAGVVDWRAERSIAGELVENLGGTNWAEAAWVVAEVGTGTTATTFGRHFRLHGSGTRVCTVERAPLLDQLGRPRLGQPVAPGLVDAGVEVTDAAAIATALWVAKRIGRPVGPSTGAAVWGALTRVSAMRKAEEEGAVVAVLADEGERYAGTINDAAWLRKKGIDLAWANEVLARFEGGA